MRYSALAAAITTLALTACSPSPEADPDEALGAGSTKIASDNNPTPVGEGPFGFEFGMPIAEAGGATPLEKPGYYEVTALPKPHPDFESVVLVAYPDTGICEIRGIGRTIEGDGSGGRIRAKVDDLSDALSTKYGKSTKFDRCSGGEIQCDGQFWMMTLDSGERAYGHEWTTQNDTMRKNKVGEIYVGAAAVNIQASYPLLEFHSDNKTGCDKAEKASSVSSL